MTMVVFCWLLALIIAGLVGWLMTFPFHSTSTPWLWLGVGSMLFVVMTSLVAGKIGPWCRQRGNSTGCIGRVLVGTMLVGLIVWGFGLNCFIYAGHVELAAFIAVAGPVVWLTGLIVSALWPSPGRQPLDFRHRLR